MRVPEYTAQFKRDYKRVQKRGWDVCELQSVMEKLLAEDIPLPLKNRDHRLSGDYIGCRECHVGADWLLVYYYVKDDVVVFYRTGTHADLFG